VKTWVPRTEKRIAATLGEGNPEDLAILEPVKGGTVAIESEVARMATKAKRWARSEVLRQEMQVEGMIVLGLTDRQISSELRKEWSGMTEARVIVLRKRIVERARNAQREKDPDAYRYFAVQRLHQQLRNVSGRRTPDGKDWVEKPNHQAVARYEKLIMDVEGTAADKKIKVDVDATYTQAMIQVIASLDGEEAAALLEEAREQQAWAEEGRRLLPAVKPPVSDE
jgi:hypothetical protein